MSSRSSSSESSTSRSTPSRHANESYASNLGNHVRPSARDYEYFEQLYDPDAQEIESNRRPTRTRSKNRDAEIVAALTNEARGGEAGFTTSYRPARHEAGWLMDSLGLFYANDMISDILAIIKGGKEATVYRCRGTRAAQHDIVAAKVYRPRQFRNLRNDKIYKEGREILTADGRPVKATDHRLIRALNKKTTFGKQVEHTSWLMYEFTTLQSLHAAGVAAPEPIAASENAILMQHIGDETVTAPTLHEVSLPLSDAKRLFDASIEQIERMLAAGMVHGDLSAYNILYWEGEICLIDFPQVTNSLTNSNARAIFTRDVRRVCEYFRLQGIDSKPDALAAALWNRYETRREADRLAEFSRHEPADQE